MRLRQRDPAWLAALAAVLLAFFLWPFLLHGERFPLGPDGPVYLWWTRLAAHEGLSAVGDRPGVPALALVLAGTLRTSPVAILAGLEVALGVSVGLAAAALLHRAARAAWILAGLLAGTFAVHLAAGYLANLAFAVGFTAAVALLARGTPRATTAAAALLGAGGLAHPPFFLLGLAILGLAALGLQRDEAARADANRVAVAAVAGGAVLGAGLLTLLPGPDPLSVDTSKDAFLRRAGLTGSLRSAHWDRLTRHWARYVQWASLPLALIGLGGPPRIAGRILGSWLALTVAGVVLGLATALVPPDRFVTFGYAIPILAALGLVRLGRVLERAPQRHTAARRALILLVVGALTGAMLLGAAFAWLRQRPFLTTLEVARVTAAARAVTMTPPGTPLVFVVNDDDDTVTFLASRAANVIRAGVPPDRIRDVFVYVGTPSNYLAGRPTVTGSEERDLLSRLSLEDVPSDPTPAAFVLAPFDRADLTEADRIGERVARGVFAFQQGAISGEAAQPLRPSSPGGIVAAAVGILALLTAVGAGWARAAVGPGLGTWALAPALGSAGLVLAGLVAERLGTPLAGSVGPSAVSVTVAALGGIAALVAGRRRDPS